MDVLSDGASLGKKVIVLGVCLIGCERAGFQADRGKAAAINVDQIVEKGLIIADRNLHQTRNMDNVVLSVGSVPPARTV